MKRYEASLGVKLTDDQIELVRRSFQSFLISNRIRSARELDQIRKENPKLFSDADRIIGTIINAGADISIDETED